MKTVRPWFKVIFPENPKAVMLRLEEAARTCYQSFDRTKSGSCNSLLRAIIKSGHESVIEHEKISVRISLSRGTMDELTRHRLASFSVESTRYCKYDSDIEFVTPRWWNRKDMKKLQRLWLSAMKESEGNYKSMIDSGAHQQIARDCLNLATKSELVITANLREWRHIFKLRCSTAAHPEISRIMCPILTNFSEKLPVIFNVSDLADPLFSAFDLADDRSDA